MGCLSDRIQRPVFIVSAPRSGSTVLFETLARAQALWTIGGESHHLIEGLPQLSVGRAGVDSNRLTDANADPVTAQRIRLDFAENLIDRDGLPCARYASRVRMLEKTPKNSLRIPFLLEVFPDALFIYLYRDPRENISSIMEAWRAGSWITYPHLPDWDGPWSLLLPPGYPALRGKSLVQIAAFQWISANQYILRDLASLPKSRWMTVGYDQLTEDPAREVRRICQFIDIAFDAELGAVVGAKLPLSRYTLTPPAREKWRKNGEAIATVLAQVLHLYRHILENALPADEVADKVESFTRAPIQIRRDDCVWCGEVPRVDRKSSAVVRLPKLARLPASYRPLIPRQPKPDRARPR